MLELVGINGSYIEDLFFDGRLNTNVNLWIHSGQSFDPINGPVTSGVQFRRCFFTNVTGAGSANVLVGDYDQVNTWQCDTLTWHDCVFYGDAGVGGTCEANWRTLCPGNCKNFQFVGGSMSNAHYGINWAYSSGFLHVIDCAFGTHTVASINPGFACLLVDSCEIENVAPAAFIKSVPPEGGVGPGNLIVENCQWNGTLPSDNVVIAFYGSMVLIGNQFLHSSPPPGSLPPVGIPTIRVADTRLVSGQTVPSFLYSAGNFFENAVDYIPVIDFGDNVIVGPYGYGATNNNNVFSLGDFGIIYEINPQGTNIRKLKPWAGVPAQMGSLAPLEVLPKSSLGVTVQSLAELRRVVAKFHIDYAEWTDAAHSHQIYWGFPAKTRICGIIVDTTEAYAGVTGPISLMVGILAANDESYIKSHIVSSAPVTKGLSDADLGSRLNRANAVQGGDIQSWTSKNFVAVTLSGAADLGTGPPPDPNMPPKTNLTAGSTTLYVITESMP
jgi:hypothetical protein